MTRTDTQRATRNEQQRTARLIQQRRAAQKRYKASLAKPVRDDMPRMEWPADWGRVEVHGGSSLADCETPYKIARSAGWC